MKKYLLSFAIVSQMIILTACGNTNENTSATAKDAETQTSKLSAEQSSSPQAPSNIDTLANAKIEESIKFLNEESRRSATDDDYFKYTLDAKNIIKSDLNHDGKIDYLIEASFCEETNCHITTRSYELFVFTTDDKNQINFITKMEFGLNAKVTNISNDGIITIENHEYADDDPSCCPSIVNTQSYALVGKKLALLAKP